ncbi:Dipeptidyl aminopeptidase/acylaminoacyl-peptidase [Labilithrix luteola]|uniref:Dipeptidyl aminopeptidase/acylaminoacyl-peptidase n=1 Tax=Labilithrix luteola TaxID=1391654 RepID=A0A0K1QFR6_9BACT|nr:prolyl oligopeptidase family serine peptidase [Labilithrix luteola]AKV04502.1 Dipeptidyl aminopeptidase/acylaminoacyl-peptidase [Labilithrix luteola]
MLRRRFQASSISVVTVLSALALASGGTACGGSDDPATDAPVAQTPDSGTSTTGSTPGTGGDGAASDAAGDGTASDASTTSRCKVTPTSVSCEHNVTKLTAGTATRDVYWQTPTTPPPAAGYPVVVLYQGSFAGPSLTWGELGPNTVFGGFYQGVLQAKLLDSGFTVIAPSAAVGIAWQTNSGLPWDATTDKDVIDALLADVAAGKYGPADMTRLYATGISSGGYMTSRMAVSYAGKFRALAIQSASYATCIGPVCNVPSELPKDHPPTLFLHGEKDTTVPLFTAQAYHDALGHAGIETSMITDPDAGHQWLEQSPDRITDWFTNH